jgi:hypothetical protein
MELQKVVTAWTAIHGAPLAAFNALLTQHNLKPIAATASPLAAPECSRP